MPPLSSSQELAVQTQIVRIMCKAHERAEWVSVQLAWVEKPCRVAGAGMRVVWGPTRAGFRAAVEGKVMRSLRGAGGGSLGPPVGRPQDPQDIPEVRHQGPGGPQEKPLPVVTI